MYGFFQDEILANYLFNNNDNIHKSEAQEIRLTNKHRKVVHEKLQNKISEQKSFFISLS